VFVTTFKPFTPPSLTEGLAAAVVAVVAAPAVVVLLLFGNDCTSTNLLPVLLVLPLPLTLVFVG